MEYKLMRIRLKVFLCYSLLPIISMSLQVPTGGGNMDHCDTYGEIRIHNGSLQAITGTQANIHQGTVQVCFYGGPPGHLMLKWHNICSDGWTNNSARVACRQQRYFYTGAVSKTFNKTNKHTNTVKFRDCTGMEENITECMGEEVNSNCNQLAGAICQEESCYENGAVRIHTRKPWSFNNSGLIQICIEKSSNLNIWSPICARAGWTNRHAITICKQLGHPYREAIRKNEISNELGNLSIRAPNCTTQQFKAKISTCDINITRSEDCTLFAGVDCRVCKEGLLRKTMGGDSIENCTSQSWKKICNIPNEEESTGSSTTEYPNQFTTPTQTGTVTSKCTLTTACPITDTSKSSNACISFGLFGGIIGLLLVLLAIAATGWVWSCILLKREKSLKDKSRSGPDDRTLHNPVFDSESTPRNLDNPSYEATAQPQTNYSSLGPAYELVDANEGAGHAYDVINQRGGRQVTRPQNTPPRSHEQNYNVLDHTGRPDRHDNQVNESNQQENVYHVLEQSNEPSIDPEDHDYFVLENGGSGPKGGPKGAPNVQGGGEHIDSSPLDYEVPNQIPREAWEEGVLEAEALED